MGYRLLRRRLSKRKIQDLVRLRQSMGYGIVNQRLHLARSVFENLLLLSAQFALHFSQLALLFAQRPLLLAHLALFLARHRLKIAEFALQFANLALNPAKILLSTACAQLLQLGFEFMQIFRHIRNLNVNFLLLFAQSLLFFAKSFLLLAQLFLLFVELLNRGEKILRALDRSRVANHVGLAVAPEPDEVPGNFLLEKFHKFGRVIRTIALAIPGNTYVRVPR